MQRQAPVSAVSGREFEFGASFVLRHPEIALLVKYAAFLAGIFLLLKAVDVRLFSTVERTLRDAFPRMGGGLIAAILTFIFFVFSEPFLLKAAPISEYRIKLAVPVIGNTAPAAAATPSTPPTMDITTILSITAFAAIQLGMYVICLLKISEISRQELSAATKLELMQNEENLFDGGLYVGIAGTVDRLGVAGARPDRRQPARGLFLESLRHRVRRPREDPSRPALQAPADRREPAEHGGGLSLPLS